MAATAGSARPAVAEQQAASTAVRPGSRCPVGSVADQRAPQQKLSRQVDQVEQVVGRTGFRACIRSRSCGECLRELGMKDPGLRTQRLITLRVAAEQRHDGRGHFIGAGRQYLGGRAGRNCVGHVERRS